MSDTVAQMTKGELREMIESAVGAAVEQKLVEILGDPDEGLELCQTIRTRVLQQQQAVLAGDRGQEFGQAIERLGLDS